jgi:hypothetical protein
MTADEALALAARSGLPAALAARVVLDTPDGDYTARIQAAAQVLVLCRLADRLPQAEALVPLGVEAARAELSRQLVAASDASYVDKVPRPAGLIT